MKKAILSLVVFIISSLALFAFPACNGSETRDGVSSLAAENLKNANFVRWIGRTEYDSGDKNVYCYYTATGFAVKFTGTSLDVTFNADNTSSDKNRPYFIASADGEIAPDGEVFCLTQSTQTVRVADLPQGEHTVTLLKCSEPENSLTSIEKIETDGKFERPPARTGLKFQILGGSGISGHGCLGTPDEGWTTENSSSLCGFGYLAARTFGAETQFVSNSGMGLLWGYRGVENLSAAYEATGLVAKYNAFGATEKVSAKGEWNHAGWVPDCVIVNIGGNDWNSHISGLSGSARTKAETEFKNAVKSFLTRVNGLYPDAYIVWTCNSERSGNGALAADAIKSLDFKDKIAVVEIDNSKNGADNHADLATQIANAQTVADAITSNFGLQQIRANITP